MGTVFSACCGPRDKVNDSNVSPLSKHRQFKSRYWLVLTQLIDEHLYQNQSNNTSGYFLPQGETSLNSSQLSSCRSMDQIKGNKTPCLYPESKSAFQFKLELVNEYEKRIAGKTEREFILEQRFQPRSIIIEDPNDNSCYNSSIVTQDIIEREREKRGSYLKSHLMDDESIGSVKRVTEFGQDHDNDSRHFQHGISDIHSSISSSSPIISDRLRKPTTLTQKSSHRSNRSNDTNFLELHPQKSPKKVVVIATRLATIIDEEVPVIVQEIADIVQIVNSQQTSECEDQDMEAYKRVQKQHQSFPKKRILDNLKHSTFPRVQKNYSELSKQKDFDSLNDNSKLTNSKLMEILDPNDPVESNKTTPKSSKRQEPRLSILKFTPGKKPNTNKSANSSNMSGSKTPNNFDLSNLQLEKTLTPYRSSRRENTPNFKERPSESLYDPSTKDSLGKNKNKL